MQEEKKISIPLIIGGLVLVIIVGAGGILIAVNQANSANNATTGQQIESIPNVADTIGTTTTTTPPVAVNTTYKNGTYTASGSYISPGGDQSIDVNLTIANDTITAVTVTPRASDEESARYQSKFASGISSAVVGKKLSATSVGRVNGSSLTGTGFNSALARIKSQAQA
ncbi:MAG: hypothetical protein ACMG57_01430 [Candidatus Dojkabacteria bacterium]